jgi:hypothetical protein
LGKQSIILREQGIHVSLVHERGLRIGHKRLLDSGILNYQRHVLASRRKARHSQGNALHRGRLRSHRRQSNRGEVLLALAGYWCADRQAGWQTH